MKGKEMLMLIDEIDEKIIDRANEIMEQYQGVSNSDFIPVNAKNNFAWKQIAAVIVCTFAVLAGTAALMLSIGRVDDIPTSSTDSGIDSNHTSNGYDNIEQSFNLENISLISGLTADNQSINLKSPVPAKICYISKTNTLLYSDKDGFFIKNNAKTYKLSDLEAMSITVYKGNLYFIIPTNNSEFPSGRVYRIDSETGEIKCIIDNKNISNIVIDNGSLYYTEQIIEKIDNDTTAVGNKYMTCDLDGENIAKDSKHTVATDDKYVISYMQKNLSIYRKEESDPLLSFGNIESADEICVYKDKVYYIDYDYENVTQNRLCIIDCADGSVKKIAAKSVGGESAFLLDYGFIGDDLYLYDGISFYKYVDGNLSEVFVYNEFEAIYSGGNYLYGLKHDGTISRLNFTGKNIEEEVLKYE